MKELFLKKGDIFKLTKGMEAYIEIPSCFVYDNTPLSKETTKRETKIGEIFSSKKIKHIKRDISDAVKGCAHEIYFRLGINIDSEFKELIGNKIIDLYLKKYKEETFDRTRLFYFNEHQVGVVTLPQKRKTRSLESAIILNFPSDVINDVFWYADSYHIILICSKRILICEAHLDAAVVTLVNLTKQNATGFYDIHTDSLYFTDSQGAADGNVYDNLYRLEMRNRVYPFSLPDFITLKGLEQHMNLLDWRIEEKKDGKKR